MREKVVLPEFAPWVSHADCGMGQSECEIIAAKMKEEEAHNPERRQVLYRAVIAPIPGVQNYHWGRVTAHPGRTQGFTCLKKDRFRVRVEGWTGDRVSPARGWTPCSEKECTGQIVIVTWTPAREPGLTAWGDGPPSSGHEKSYWIEYVGRHTGELPRRAGPFGCTGDPVDHAMEDGGFEARGKDGDYFLYDKDGNVVDVPD
jgi:hypothetical protein